jgi:hypothetical protein
MGNTIASGGSTKITRQQLLDSTRDNREFTNKIFKVMTDKLTPTDILELSDSSKCSKYVFLMAQSIGKIFDDLRIIPRKDSSSGIVYYQKVDELTKPKDETSKRQTRELCLIIAYFNIRLFQIFGALTLSIVDDNSAGAILGSLYSGSKGDRMYTFEQKEPGRRGLMGGPSVRPGSKPTLIGGAVDDSFFSGIAKSKFKIFKDILDGPSELIIDSDIRIKEALKFQDSDIYLFFDNRSSRNLYYNDGDNYYYCTMNANVYLPNLAPQGYGQYGPPMYPQYGVLQPRPPTDNFTRIKVSLSNYKYINKNLDDKATTEINKRITRISSDFTIVTDGIDWRIDDTTNTQFISKFKSDFYRKIAAQVKSLIPSMDISITDDKSSKVTESSSSDKILRTKYIIDTIKQIASGNTTSFCVARALQLIDARSVLVPKPTTITSGVCKKSPPGLVKSLPISKLTDVPGLQALDQLYFKSQLKEDGTRDFIPDMYYIEFLDVMRKAFNEKAPTTLKGLESIPSKSFDECGRDAVEKYLFISDPKKIKEIMSYVNTLFGIQLNHTKSVINFFKTRLFLIKKTDKGTSIDIHPSLLSGDLNELEKVSKEARVLLVNYYTGCEAKYQDGLKIVLEGKKYKTS